MYAECYDWYQYISHRYIIVYSCLPLLGAYWYRLGMGEPLANYDNVLSAVRRLNTDLGL